MKPLVLFLSLLISAKAMADSIVVITPDHPTVRCNQNNPGSYINHIDDFTATEDDKVLMISFNTYYYQTCENGVPNLLDIAKRFYFNIWPEGYRLPWTTPTFYEEVYSLPNSKNLFVQLAFDKVKQFKKSSLRKIYLQFTPDGFNHKGITFGWRLKLEKIDNFTTKISF